MIKSFSHKLNILVNLFYQRMNTNYLSYLQNKEIIWHVATMRSASNFLNGFINEFSNFRTFNINNKQTCLNDIIDLQFVTKQLRQISNFNHWISRNCHLTPNLYNLNRIDKKDVIIIQYRNILDIILSLYDLTHEKIKKNEYHLIFPNGFKTFSLMNDEEKIDLIIKKYLPFHIEFLISWSRYTHSRKIFIEYNDIIDQNFLKKLKNIIQFKKFDTKDLTKQKASSIKVNTLDKKIILNKIENYVKNYYLDSNTKELLFQKIK